MKYFLAIAFTCITTASFGQAGTPGEPSIYSFVEQMPQPGFNVGEYLSKNIHYPSVAIKNKVQGRVVLRYVVNEDGTLSDFQVMKSVSKECDAEAIRVMSLMPAWKPGKQNGKYVKVFFTQPISFNLE